MNKVERLKKDYFETVMYGNPLTAVNPVLLINTDKFSLEKRFDRNGGMTFREFANKYYNDPILIGNPGGVQGIPLPAIAGNSHPGEPEPPLGEDEALR